MKKLLVITAAYLMLFAAANANAGNLITNPSFEQGIWDGNYSWTRIAPGGSNLTGWTIGLYGVDWHNSAEMQSPQNGSYVVDLNLNGDGKTGTLSQTFATTVGAQYDLSFYIANPYNYSPSSTLLRVNIAGNDYDFSPDSSKTSPLTWVEKTVHFQAQNSQTTLTFSSMNGDGWWGPVLDNVSVTPAPEPASMLLGLLGLGGVMGARKRTA